VERLAQPAAPEDKCVMELWVEAACQQRDHGQSEQMEAETPEEVRVLQTPHLGSRCALRRNPPVARGPELLPGVFF
jgi:hypothetical protein